MGWLLQGGLNYWVETIINPQKPASTSPDDEFAKYDFRKAAGNAITGGGAELATPASEVKTLPKVKRKKKKKSVQGGC